MRRRSELKFNKNLRALILSLVAGLFGCSNNSDSSFYEFEGKIGDNKVSFHNYSGLNKLDVRKNNLDYIKYFDFKKDFKVDCIRFGRKSLESNFGESKLVCYYDDENAKKIIGNAQKEFNSYLVEIYKIKTLPYSLLGFF